MNTYNKLSDTDKKTLIKREYEDNKLSFIEIAKKYNTYANKIRRDAIKFKIKVRDKSVAQKTALKQGRHKHPTKGTTRPENTKEKIGRGVLNSWLNLSPQELERRKDIARDNWEKLSDDEKKLILQKANVGVRQSSVKGSKLELYLLDKLLANGFHVDFHKEQILSNTKLQIDLFLPKIGVAIEIDGPSHFEAVWGQDSLQKSQKYDNKKNGLILGKDLYLIRIKQNRDFSKSRADIVLSKILEVLNTIKSNPQQISDKYIELGDN